MSYHSVNGERYTILLSLKSWLTQLLSLLQIGIATTLHKVHKVGLKQIAVLTPYSAQKNLIDEKMKEAKLDIKVASITESQGECTEQSWLYTFHVKKILILFFR